MSHSIATTRIVRFALIAVILVTFGSAFIEMPTVQVGKYWSHLPNFFLFSAQHPTEAYQLSQFLSENSELADWWSEHSDLMVSLVPDDRLEVIAKNPWILNVLRASYTSNSTYLLSLSDQDQADLLNWLAAHPEYQKYLLANPSLLGRLQGTNYSESVFESKIVFLSPAQDSTVFGIVPVQVYAYSPYSVSRTTVSYTYAGSTEVIASVIGENVTHLWNTNGLPPGEYTLQATAKTGNGTDLKTSTRVFLLSGVRVTILLPTDGSTISDDFAVQADVASSYPIAQCNATLVGARRSYTYPLQSQGSGKYGTTVSSNAIVDGQYVLTVTAQDPYGIWSASSITITVSKVPSVSITAPTQGTTLTGSFTLRATVSSIDPISRCSATLTGGGNSYSYELSDPDGDKTYTANIDPTGIKNGDYTITVLAVDSDGSQASNSVPVRISSAPSVSILSPTPGATLQGNFTVQARVTSADTISSCKASLTKGDSTYSYDLSDPDGSGVYTATISPATIADGSYTLVVTAEKADGSTGSRSISIGLSNPPTVTITAPTQGQRVYGSFTVQAQASGVRTISTCNAAFEGTTSALSRNNGYFVGSVNSLAVGDGFHTLTVTASDSLGSSNSASITVYVDNVPDVTLQAPSSGSFQKNSFTVQAGVTSLHSVTSVTVYVDGSSAGTLTSQGNGLYSKAIDSTTLSEGSHSLYVRVVNSQGLSNTTSTRTIYVDNLASTVVINAPANGSRFSGSSITVNATIADYTNWVKVYINGVPVQAYSYGNAYVNTVQYSISTSGMIFYTNGTIVTVGYESAMANSNSSYIVVYGTPPSSIIRPIVLVNSTIRMPSGLNLHGIPEETW